MLKKILNKIETYKKQNKKFYLHEYKTKDGGFDYDLYKKIQTDGNKRKIDRSWINESDIDFLSSYIRSHNKEVVFGICHGTRRGLEQQWFAEKLGCKVIGTEISDTATAYPNTIQWDFHEENPDWVAKADFVYTNSFDHAYSPEKALTAWMNTLKPGGVCFLEHTSANEAKYSTVLDPFGASLDVMPFLILQWGKGRYSVREIIHKDAAEGDQFPRSFIVVMNN